SGRTDRSTPAIRAQSAGRSVIVTLPEPGTSPYDDAVLDDRDRDILAALQEDARATYADIAARIGMSASAVHERVRKLEQSGTIRGYKAVVSAEAVGLFVTALISAAPLDPQQPDDLPDRVA